MRPIDEPAPAKVNLTLRVLGRRPDGYHLLESLVVFAETGDRLTLTPGPDISFSITGPFATAIGPLPQGANLVERAIEAARRAAPGLRLGAFTLHKALPVAAGLGGGSADAAAALRAIARANPEDARRIDWQAIARTLGADVPVCLAGRPAMMRGIGEMLSPLPSLPSLPALLVNPGVPLSTRAVFEALNAPPAPAERAGERPSGGAAVVLALSTFAQVLTHILPRGNDLEETAARLCPPVSAVLHALRASAGCRLARLSGSGPTCFGLFENAAAASEAGTRIAAAHPDWWVCATGLA